MKRAISRRAVLLGCAVLALILGVGCGGGDSTPPPNNPVPAVSGVQPATMTAGSNGFTLTVTGSNFISNSVVRWNGAAKSTTYSNSTSLQASITAADVASAGSIQVTVYNPAPGGGVSNAMSFTVTATNNPVPSISSISPTSVSVGAAAFTLTVRGSGFSSTSIVRWNGANRPTAFVNSGELHASIGTSDVVSSIPVQVTVYNPAPGGGTSNAAQFTIVSGSTTLSLPTNELIWDAGRAKIYASVPSRAGVNGNSIAIIDPVTSAISYVFIGSEPNRLAISDDGQYLYVGLDGAAAVRRLNLNTQTPEIQFTLGSDSFFGPMYADDIEVMPGNPHTVAISRRNQGYSPRHMGVGIYDDGVCRPTTTPVHTGANVIEFGSSPEVLYGYNNETTEFGFRRMRVDQSGVTVIDVAANLISGFGMDIEYEGGRIFSDGGRAIDPISDTILGTYVPPSGVWFSLAFRPEASANRVYFMSDPIYGAKLYSYVMDTFVPYGSLQVNTGGSWLSSLIRWGEDGFAFRNDADQVVLFHGGDMVRVEPLEIATQQLPPTTGGKQYDFVLAARGGAPPITWRLVNGAVPGALALDAAGHISGTVSAVTSDTPFAFTVEATDASSSRTTRDLAITVKSTALGTNDTCATATPISNGRIRASLSPYGDIDVYAFDGTAGSAVTAETFADRLELNGDPSTVDSFVDTFLEILDSSCTPLASNDDSGQTTLDSLISNFTLPYSGRYFVRVSDWRGDGRPDLIYELVLSGIR